jgi:hypothetical protein
MIVGWDLHELFLLPDLLSDLHDENSMSVEKRLLLAMY